MLSVMTVASKNMLRICVAGGCFIQTSESINLHKFPIKDNKRCVLWNRFVRVKRVDWTGPSAHSMFRLLSSI